MQIENLEDIAQHLDNEDLLPNVTYVESEGDDVIRIDYGNDVSLWLYANGSIDGQCPKKAKPYLKSLNFNV